VALVSEELVVLIIYCYSATSIYSSFEHDNVQIKHSFDTTTTDLLTLYKYTTLGKCFLLVLGDADLQQRTSVC